MANRIELGVCMMVTRELLPCRLLSMGPGSPPAERKSSLDFKSFRLAFGGWEGKRIHNYVSAYVTNFSGLFTHAQGSRPKLPTYTPRGLWHTSSPVPFVLLLV